jgi:multicomponent Na+:H+ antiporter subunit A
MIFLFTTFTGKFDSKQMPQQPHEAKFGMLLPPAILASLTLVIGLFPNIVSYPLIEPALASIFPNLLDTGERFFVKISFWHGWNTELFMTIGVVIIGVALYITRKRWQSKFQLFPEKYSFNRLYDITLVGLEKVSSRLTNFYMTGDLRHYLIYIFIFLILIVGGLTLFTSSWDFSQMSVAPIMFYEVLLVIVLIMSAVAIPFAKSRLQMIILVGAVGYMVALFFVLFRAPDLALTQMIVETVSVALFLLCFYHLQSY